MDTSEVFPTPPDPDKPEQQEASRVPVAPPFDPERDKTGGEAGEEEAGEEEEHGDGEQPGRTGLRLPGRCGYG